MLTLTSIVLLAHALLPPAPDVALVVLPAEVEDPFVPVDPVPPAPLVLVGVVSTVLPQAKTPTRRPNRRKLRIGTVYNALS